MSGVKILVTTDGSSLSDKAVDTAVELARQLGADLIGMTSVTSPAPLKGFEGEEQIVKDRLEAVSRKASQKGVACDIVAEHSDSISAGVLECARRNDVAFIVMASRGLGTIGALLLGSETQKVLHQADRPVLVVR